MVSVQHQSPPHNHKSHQICINVRIVLGERLSRVGMYIVQLSSPLATSKRVGIILADRTNGHAYATVLCPSVCRL